MRPPRRGSIEAAFQLLPHAAAPGAPRFALEPAGGVLAAGAALVRPGRLCWPGCLPCSHADAWPRRKAGKKKTTKQKNTRVAPQRSVGGGGGGGKRDPRAPQAVRARMVGDALGDFSQTFQWAVEGAAAPVRLEVRGRVVPPAVKVRCPRGVMAPRARTWLSTRLKLPIVYTEHVPAWPRCSARDQANAGCSHAQRPARRQTRRRSRSAWWRAASAMSAISCCATPAPCRPATPGARSARPRSRRTARACCRRASPNSASPAGRGTHMGAAAAGAVLGCAVHACCVPAQKVLVTSINSRAATLIERGRVQQAV